MYCILMQSCWTTGQVCDAYVRTHTIYVQRLLGLKRACLCKFLRQYKIDRFLSRNFVNITKIVPISTKFNENRPIFVNILKLVRVTFSILHIFAGKDKINFAKVCEDF